jgi:hypothetical protein
MKTKEITIKVNEGVIKKTPGEKRFEMNEQSKFFGIEKVIELEGEDEWRAVQQETEKMRNWVREELKK